MKNSNSGVVCWNKHEFCGVSNSYTSASPKMKRESKITVHALRGTLPTKRVRESRIPTIADSSTNVCIGGVDICLL